MKMAANMMLSALLICSAIAASASNDDFGIRVRIDEAIPRHLCYRTLEKLEVGGKL